jgi:monoamine oxidase
VTILEGDARHLGGRVRTLRFADGRYGEAGAMRIPKRHDLTRRYIAEFRLPLRTFVHSNAKAYYFVRGERRRIADVKALFARYQLRGDERNVNSPDDYWSLAVTKTAASLTDAERREMRADTLTSANLLAYDRQSLLQLCEAAGLSQEAIEFLVVTSAEETLLASAATETLREEFEEIWTSGFDEIVGGTDRLASAFAAHLKAKPRLGCVVTHIKQDVGARRTAAIFHERGVEKRIEGDFLLCTLPCPVLSRITIEPELSGPKWRAIRELNYDSSTKVIAVARRRFWEMDDGIFGGGTFTDLPIGTTYYPSDNAQRKDPRVSAGPGVMLRGCRVHWNQGSAQRAKCSRLRRKRSDAMKPR